MQGLLPRVAIHEKPVQADPRMMRLLDLFSGIGGFSLGLERTGGFRTAAFCEIEPYCRAVISALSQEVA
jgi:DNA (cytosine-5)-methyltransferase 1